MYDKQDTLIHEPLDDLSPDLPEIGFSNPGFENPAKSADRVLFWVRFQRNCIPCIGVINI